MKTRNLLRKLRKALARRLHRHVLLTMLGAAGFITWVGAPNAGAASASFSNQRQAGDGHYNLKLGNLRLALSGYAEVGYDDNISRSDNLDGVDGVEFKREKAGGWFTEVGLSLSAEYPLTDYGRLSGGISTGYRYYPDGSGEDNFFISGDGGALSAAVSAELNVGQTGKLTIADSISRDIESLQISVHQQDGALDRYSLTRNVTSLEYAGNLNDYWNQQATYAHSFSWASPTKYKYQNSQSDMLDYMLQWEMRKGMQIGPYGTVSHTYYMDADPGNGFKRNDSYDYSAGLALNYQRKAGFAANARLGYQWVDFNDDSAAAQRDVLVYGSFGAPDPHNPASDSQTGTVSYSLDASFASSQRVTHSLYSSYSITQDYLYTTINYAKQWQNGYGLSYQLSKDVTLRGDLAYVRSEESDNGEAADLYRLGLGTGYQLNKRTSLDLRYEFTSKISNDPTREYDRNLIWLRATYQF